jgi:DNA-binding response OmpR family regulator
MMAYIQVVTSDQARADSLRNKLSASGHNVEAGRMSESLRGEMLKAPPDAVIIDLERAPATLFESSKSDAPLRTHIP